MTEPKDIKFPVRAMISKNCLNLSDEIILYKGVTGTLTSHYTGIEELFIFERDGDSLAYMLTLEELAIPSLNYYP